MPARSNSGPTKPKRESKKPATFVPGVSSTIVKKTRATPKPKPSSVKKVKKETPKKSPKKAPKSVAKSTGRKPATPSKVATHSKTTTPKKAPKASPKKTALAKTTKAKKSAAARRHQPKYVDMIIEGIKSLHKKTGSSRQAIVKFIEENYPQRPDSKKWIRITLNKLTQEGTIEKIRGSYKLFSKKSVVQTKPVKKIAKKKKVTKAVKVPIAPKAPAVKAPTKSAKKVPPVVGEVPVTGSVVAAEGNGKPLWQYNHNGWQNYDTEASDLVEIQYQEWLNNNQMFDVRSVKSGNFEYNVDFRRMIQTNIQHPAHTERKIRRTYK